MLVVVRRALAVLLIDLPPSLVDLGEAVTEFNIGASESEGTKGGRIFDSKNRKTRDTIVIAIRTKL